MAEKGKKPKGGRRCVAGAPNKTSCGNNSHTEGITMHQFPTDPVVRAQWVRFVQKHRVDFGEPVNQYASLCSAHFEESCFTRNRSILEGMAASNVRRVLIKGSVPTTQLFPTVNSSFFSLFLIKYQYVFMGHLGLFFLRGIVLRGCNGSMSTGYIFLFVHECCPLPCKNWNTFGHLGARSKGGTKIVVKRK